MFRKPTFSGLGINFLSACSFRYKVNSILTLIHRAYNLSSCYLTFHKEVEFLGQFFFNNGFNLNLYYKVLRQFLNNKQETKSMQLGPKKKIMYIKIPFISDYINKIISDEFKKIFDKHLPHINLNLVFYNNFKIKSFLKIKDSLPKALRSLVVYRFLCPKCSLGYIGSTKKSLSLRVKEHQGISARTNRHLVSPLSSSIRQHCQNICEVNFNLCNFEVLSQCSSEIELRIRESIFIKTENPELNVDSSSFNFNIF